MMIPRMRTLSAAISFAILAFLVSSCAQPTGPAASGSKSFGVTDPPVNANSSFNLATPTLSGSQSAAGQVKLTWSNGRTTGSETAGGEFSPYTGAWTDATVKPGSGHTSLFMWDEGTQAWITDDAWQSTNGEFYFSDLADGTYYFYAQEKSKENLQGGETFHSRPSNVIEVVVSSCVEEWSVGTAEQPGWNAQQGTGINPNGDPYLIIVKKGNAANSHVNFHFILAASCPNMDITGRTVTVDIPLETVHGATTATEDLSVGAPPGRYMFSGNNGIWYPTVTGTYPLVIEVDGVEITPPGTWQVKVIN